MTTPLRANNRPAVAPGPAEMGASTAGEGAGQGLSVHGLTRRFAEVTAVAAATFAVPAGALTGFVGSNGAGKTTTMRMIMGILGAHGGEVRWQGRAITTPDRRTFGYLPEERGLYPRAKVLDQLVYLAALKGMPQAEARGRATELLDRFGLADRAKHKLDSLSLGNQQRVQVTAAVVARPAALILDEPFSGLDPEAVEEMVGLLSEHAAQGVPVLFSSHQLDLVDRVCDRLVIMAGGRIKAEGTTDELRAAAPPRYRLRLGGDAGWVRDHAATHPGIVVVDLDGAQVVVDSGDPERGILPEAANQMLLAEAMRRGSVHELSPLVPRLADIYRALTR